MTKLLGIECTAHTLGASIVESSAQSVEEVSTANTRIVSNVSVKYPSLKEGLIPRKMADHHAKAFKKVVAQALKLSKTSLDELSAIAYSQCPGIGHCLHIGYIGTKALADFLRLPLIGVNHALAHVEVGRWLFASKDPLVVYVSGGNTQIAALDASVKRYRIYGETLDIGLGNALDILGRVLNLKPPDAVGVLKAASLGKNFIDLPYTVKGMSVAYSGLLTACSEAIKRGAAAEDLCFSAQEVAFAALVEASERCLCHTRNPDLLLCGGNARNQRLCEMFAEMCKEHGTRFIVTPPELSGDNGAMIALNGLLFFLTKNWPTDARPRQRARLDEPRIEWWLPKWRE